MDKKRSTQSDLDQAMIELGLTLIKEYREGKTKDREKTLSAIIHLYAVSKERSASTRT